LAVQFIQILGAVGILSAFFALQARLLPPRSYPYLLLNVLGSCLLLYAALAEQQWGFVLLQVAWISVSAWGIYRRFRDGPLAVS
jgi:hypothetical protein